MSVEVEEAGVELVSRHRDQSVQEVQQLRGPVEVLLHDEAGVGVVTGSVPAHQAGLVFPLPVDLDLFLVPLTVLLYTL